MNAASRLLSMQYPDMPIPHLTICTERLAPVKKAQDKLFFFHNFHEHWALPYCSENVVYLYDSLQPKYINADLCKQLVALYDSDTIVKIPLIQLQKGYKDCGCFAIAFCVSLMFGDDPAALCYDQKEMRSTLVLHLKQNTSHHFHL